MAKVRFRFFFTLYFLTFVFVCVFFQCGVDVNRPDSYDQSALDIVNKFTTSRAAKELKQLLKGTFTTPTISTKLCIYHSFFVFVGVCA